MTRAFYWTVAATLFAAALLEIVYRGDGWRSLAVGISLTLFLTLRREFTS